jgi:hypothetical protein
VPRGVFVRTKPAPRMDRIEYLHEAVTRFWSKVQRGAPDECWPWTGTFLKGSRPNLRYGNLGLDGGVGSRKYQYRAHRFAWMLANGAIPDGMNVLHRCDNPKCCNPSHLFIGTQRDNIDDQLAKGRWLRGERAGRAKLTEADVMYIRQSTESDSDLGRRYGVYPTTINAARIGKKWAHLPGARPRRAISAQSSEGSRS